MRAAGGRAVLSTGPEPGSALRSPAAELPSSASRPRRLAVACRFSTLAWVALLLLPLAARAEPIDPAAVLPSPTAARPGSVPLSEPVAPVPPGEPKWMLSLEIAGGVADPFYDKVALLGSVRRGFGPFALELFGGRAFSWAAPAFEECVQPGQCTSPTSAQLRATPGQLDWLGGLGGVVRGGFGKVSVAGLEAARFTLEAGLGAAFVGWQVNDGRERSPFSPAARAEVAVGAALGSSFSARLELSELFYPTDIRGSSGIERQLLLGAALAWVPGAK